MPGADAMNQLKTLDAKIKATRQGMKDHLAKEKLVSLFSLFCPFPQSERSVFSCVSLFVGSHVYVPTSGEDSDKSVGRKHSLWLAKPVQITSLSRATATKIQLREFRFPVLTRMSSARV